MSLHWKCQIVAWSFYGLLAAGIPTLYGGMRWTVALRAADPLVCHHDVLGDIAA